ncbi:hypothetical protein Nos7524_4030 [Nostoc sp. PCC 7524]|uniref:hypothetical protein n=1 Tax=Nostoc sp. (strain ATCC 29411 / PCC 7524) TaxID=28072 RepID=UPI00029F3B79|nr:hypothetical protein [Nostoc sp. PCC 7524]AFY49802.1 hypothetical protein Nos7524_4030 [Nostoc sp. PCC 7524]
MSNTIHNITYHKLLKVYNQRYIVIGFDFGNYLCRQGIGSPDEASFTVKHEICLSPPASPAPPALSSQWGMGSRQEDFVSVGSFLCASAGYAHKNQI